MSDKGTGAMNVLTTPIEISDNLSRLIGECSSCQVAVAWASARFQAFSRLVKNHRKIERMIVGLHFHQTDPEFIEAFLPHPTRVRYVRYTDGVFHPKVYLFERAGGVWECIIGSPNFTLAGFSSNDEMVVLLTNQDEGASEALARIKASISGYWLEAEPLGQDDLDEYRKEWRRKQSSLESLQTPLGTPGEANEVGKGTPIAPAKPLQKWTWQEYYGYIAARGEYAPQHYGVIGRLRVIRSVRSLFAGGGHFAEIDLDGRHKIAGTLHYAHGTVDGVNYHWFGSMWGAGKFKTAVVDGEKLSIALDAIPFDGQVTREDYLRYIKRYQNALPHGVLGSQQQLASWR
jgi:hypothetical protein